MVALLCGILCIIAHTTRKLKVMKDVIPIERLLYCWRYLSLGSSCMRDTICKLWICSGCNTEKCFFLGYRKISTVIVLYKDDVLVGLIIPNRIELIESSSYELSSQQSNFVINRTSLYLSCIRLVKVSRYSSKTTDPNTHCNHFPMCHFVRTSTCNS